MKRHSCEELANWLGTYWKETDWSNRPELGWATVRKLHDMGVGEVIRSADPLWDETRLFEFLSDKVGSPIWGTEAEFKWVRAFVDSYSNDGYSYFPGGEIAQRVLHFLGFPDFRTTLEAALVTPDASTSGIARAFGLKEDVVRCYSDLFFNVTDRRDEEDFIRHAIDDPWRHFAMDRSRLDEEVKRRTFLLLGRETNLDSVSHLAGYRVSEPRGLKSLVRRIHAEVSEKVRAELGGSLGTRVVNQFT